MRSVDRVKFLFGRLRKFEGFKEQRTSYLKFLAGVECPPTHNQISDSRDRFGKQLSFYGTDSSNCRTLALLEILFRYVEFPAVLKAV